MLLFKSRLHRQWKAHLSLFKSIADWTIYLYLMIPLFAFAYYLLRETVFQLDYGFIEYFHPGIVVFIFMYLSSILIIRTFSEPADNLFLIQSSKQYAALKRLGFYYSLICNLVYLTIFFSLLYPLFRYIHDFSSVQLIQLAVSILSCYLLGKIALLLASRWQKFFTLLFLNVLFSIIVFYANVLSIAFMIALLLFSVIIYEKLGIQTHRYFEKQTQLDVEAFYRWQSRIFLINPELKTMKLPTQKSKSPLFFKKTKSNNSVSVLIEILLKTIVRKKSYIWGYLRIICIVLPLVLVVPWWAAYLLIIIMYFGLKTYIGAIIVEIKENGIFKIIHTADHDWEVAIRKVEVYSVNSISLVYLAISTCRLLLF
ncbi:ABC transporter permease [Lysinibacillus sp. SGAir0095]|uniref:ABC transporter permease n=1 Tax=Lysinibacillus sp. SGAir0095 TaxID=2070463 RepID=UPI0010CD3BD8|nr:ABC transporter permease [Lysinibacillus sp. SGAir0095]QCR32350.1 hypothetical protein C1N55_09250 [Lysinibacillus sp. SGAir0095]